MVNSKGKIVDVCNPTREMTGSSQAIESYGISILFKRAKKRKINISTIVSDKCVSIEPRLHHFFPQAKRALDPGHRAQSLKKAIQNLTKQHKSLRGFATKIKSHYLNCITNSKNDTSNSKAENFKISF